MKIIMTLTLLIIMPALCLGIVIDSTIKIDAAYHVGYAAGKIGD